MSAGPPKLFISYRREDTAGYAGRLYDALTRRFGEEQVFMDLGIEPGVDFVEQIHDAVAASRLLLVVIGPRWAGFEDASGHRRLDDSGDFVRVEVEAALRQPNVRIIPVLVQGAKMPGAEELPPPLADLARRNALELSDSRWRHDLDRLTSTIERVLGVRARPSGVSEIPELPGVAADTTQPQQPAVAQPEEQATSAAAAPPARARRRSRLRLGLLAAAVLAVVGVVLAVVLSSGGGPRPPDLVARAAVNGQPVRISIQKHGQQATVTFRGQKGQRVAPDLRDVRMHGRLSVIDPADQKLVDQYSFDSDGLIYTIDLQRTGTYTVRIDPNGSSRGTVKLRLYDVPPDVTKRASVGGPAVPVAITSPGQLAILKFRADAGQRIGLALRDIRFEGSFDLIDPAGQKLVEGEGFDPSGDKVLPPGPVKGAGVYTIVIAPDDISTGTLKLQLSPA